MTDTHDRLNVLGGNGKQHRLRHHAKVGQPIAFVGVELGRFSDQPTAYDRAELIENLRVHDYFLPAASTERVGSAPSHEISAVGP